MSLPTAKATQSSILSFFTQKAPKYTPPPASRPAEPPAKQQPAAPPSAPPSNPPPPPSSEAKSTPPRAPSPSSPSPSPHPQAAIRPVAPADITALRRINSLLLPVAYPDAFYQNVLDPSISALFSRVITWSDDASPKVIGGIVCRVEEVSPPALSEDAPYHVLYIQSLCLLSPYRSLGLAAAALDAVLASALRDESIDVRHVYAHVWTENEDGLRWYEARGFARAGKPVEGYYFKLRPDSAWVVRRDVSPVRGAQPDAPPLAVPPSATARLANLPDRGGPPRGKSFQKMGPGAEWNDLPADMAPRGSGASSGQSSRSSSSARKKRDRAYPAQAFGS